MSKILILLFATSVVLFGCASATPQETSNTIDPNINLTPEQVSNDTPDYAHSITEDAPMGSNVLVLDDGTYVVGTDMPAGDYFIIASGPTVNATYTIITPGSADISGVASSEGTNVTLSDGQTITIKNALIMPEGAMDMVNYAAGTYLVGSDIKTGNYMIGNDYEGDVSTYVISSDKEGNDVIDSGDLMTLDTVEVVLEDGQYVTLVGSSMINMDDTVFINY